MSQCPLPDGAKRNRPPRAEAGAYLPGIFLPDTISLVVRESFEMQVDHDTVDAKAYFARYRPSPAVCRKAARGADSEREGFELVRFWLPSEGSAPCLLYLWCQVIFTVYGERLVLVPPGLCLKTKRHRELDREIRAQLGSADVTTLMRRTGLPRGQINAIAVAMVEQQRKERPGSGFKPLALGADFRGAGRSRAGKYAVLTLTASDPRVGVNLPLNFLRMPPGEGRTGPRSDIVQAAKKELLTVNAEDLLAIALDGEERLEKLVREALRLAARQNPDLKKVRLVLDRHHVQKNALEPLKAALVRTARKLDKNDPEEKKLSDLLKQARYDLEEAPDFAVQADAKRRKRLARVFKHFPHLKPYYEAFNGVRRIYGCPGVESAAKAFEAWWKGLSTRLRRSYSSFRRYVQKRWQMFLDYFWVKEETLRLHGEAYSVTTGFTEAMNDEFKSRLKLARASSLEMLAARVIARFSYQKVSRRAALKQRRAAQRAEKEAQDQQKGRAPEWTGSLPEQDAEAELAAEAALLQALPFPAPSPSGAAALG